MDFENAVGLENLIHFVLAPPHIDLTADTCGCFEMTGEVRCSRASLES
jgi:hypothetical protein